MGTETELKKQLDCHGNYEYGTVVLHERKINFVRVTDVNNLINKTVQILNSQGMLHNEKNNPDCLRILICGDKGGPSTKILCEFLNCRASHSFKTATLLGIYEGAKDDYVNVELIFGPILEQVDKLQVTDLSEIIIRCEQHQKTDIYETELRMELEFDFRQ